LNFLALILKENNFLIIILEIRKIREDCQGNRNKSHILKSSKIKGLIWAMF